MESYGAAANAIDKWRSSGGGGGQSASFHLFSPSTASQLQPQPQPAPFSTHPAPMMLHRSPSGAQKKIRQKREERNQQQQRLASASTIGSQQTHTAQSFNQYSTAWSNENVQCRPGVATAPTSLAASSRSVPSSPIDYRNLTQLNDYKSILPPPSSGLDNVWTRPVATPVSTPLSTSITSSSRFSTTVDKPPVTHIVSVRTLNEASSSPVATNNNTAYSILRGNSIEEDEYNNSGSEQMPYGECVHQRSGASSLDADAGNYQNLSFESGQYIYAHGNEALLPYDICSPQQACYVGSNKPVGQVHPMPAPRSDLCSGSTPSSSPPDTLAKRLDKTRLPQQPPPLPKKPVKLETPTVASVKQSSRLPTHEKFSKSLDLTPIGERRRGTVATNDELDTPTFPSWNSSAVMKESPASRPDAKSEINAREASGADGGHGDYKVLPSLSNLLLTDPIAIANGGGSGGHSGSSGLSSITQSTDSLPLLSASPSMLSLQNSLHHALSNPEQHTAEQLEALENRRLESIDSLSRRAAERQQDLEAVYEEVNSIDQIRLLIFKLLHGRNRLLSRLAIQIVQAERLVELETRLQLQLEKHSHSISAQIDSSECDEPATVVARKRHLAQQLEDALQLRAHYDSRDADLDRELAIFLPSDAMLEWRFYKTNAFKLNVERKQIEDRLRGVKSQLKFLESVALLQPSHHAQYSSLSTTASGNGSLSASEQSMK